MTFKMRLSDDQCNQYDGLRLRCTLKGSLTCASFPTIPNPSLVPASDGPSAALALALSPTPVTIFYLGYPE